METLFLWFYSRVCETEIKRRPLGLVEQRAEQIDTQRKVQRRGGIQLSSWNLEEEEHENVVFGTAWFSM